MPTAVRDSEKFDDQQAAAKSAALFAAAVIARAAVALMVFIGCITYHISQKKVNVFVATASIRGI